MKLHEAWTDNLTIPNTLNSNNIGSDGVVFCVEEPDLGTIENPLDKTYVPLRAELNFSPFFGSLKTKNLSEYIDGGVYHQAEQRVGEEWTVFITSTEIKNLQFYKYDFCNLRFASIFLEILLEKFINKNKIQSVWLPRFQAEDNYSQKWNRPMDNYEAFLIQSNHATLIKFFEETWRGPIKYYSNVKLRQGVSTKSNLPLHTLPFRVLSSLLYRYQTHFKFHGFIKKDRLAGSAFVTLLVQRSKIVDIAKFFLNQGTRFRIVDYGDLERFLLYERLPPTVFELEFSSLVRCPLSLIRRWVSTTCERDNKVWSKLTYIKIEDKLGKAFITDSEHDAFVCRVNDLVKHSNGCKVITLPEGGGFDYSSEEIIRFRLDGNPNLTRAFASRTHKTIYESRVNDDSLSVVSGYNTSLSVPVSIKRLMRWYLGRFYDGFNKKIIFFDLPMVHHFDVGIVRSDLRDKFLILQEVGEFLSTVNENEFVIVSNIRFDPNLYPSVGIGRIHFLPFHWSLFLEHCDILVSRQSSIILESLKLKVPVLIWDPFVDYPAQYRFIYEMACVEVAKSKADINPMLRRLSQLDESSFERVSDFIAEINFDFIQKVL